MKYKEQLYELTKQYLRMKAGILKNAIELHLLDSSYGVQETQTEET